MKKALLLIAYITFLFGQMKGIVILRDVSYEPANEFGTLNVSFHNDWKHSSTVNLTAQTLVVVERLRLHLRIMLPEDTRDEEHRRQLFQTTVDLEKIVNGLNGSFLTKALMDNLLKTGQIPSFPIPAVRKLYFYG